MTQGGSGRLCHGAHAPMRTSARARRITRRASARRYRVRRLGSSRAHSAAWAPTRAEHVVPARDPRARQHADPGLPCAPGFQCCSPKCARPGSTQRTTSSCAERSSTCTCGRTVDTRGRSSAAMGSSLSIRMAPARAAEHGVAADDLLAGQRAAASAAHAPAPSAVPRRPARASARSASRPNTRAPAHAHSSGTTHRAALRRRTRRGARCYHHTSARRRHSRRWPPAWRIASPTWKCTASIAPIGFAAIVQSARSCTYIPVHNPPLPAVPGTGMFGC